MACWEQYLLLYFVLWLKNRQGYHLCCCWAYRRCKQRWRPSTTSYILQSIRVCLVYLYALWHCLENNGHGFTFLNDIYLPIRRHCMGCGSVALTVVVILDAPKLSYLWKPIFSVYRIYYAVLWRYSCTSDGFFFFCSLAHRHSKLEKWFIEIICPAEGCMVHGAVYGVEGL